MHSLLEAKFGNFPLKLQGMETKQLSSCLVGSQLLVKTKEYTRVSLQVFRATGGLASMEATVIKG